MALGGDLTEKQRMIISGAIAGGFVVLLAVGLYMGKSKHAEITRKAKEKRAELKGYQDQVEEKRKVEMNLAEAKEKTEPYMRLLPTSTEADRLIRELGRVIMETDITWKGVSEKTERVDPAAPQFKLIEYGITLEAGFHEMVKFVNQLEDHFERFLQVQNISITAAAAGLQPGAKNHQITMRLVTYVYEGGS